MGIGEFFQMEAYPVKMGVFVRIKGRGRKRFGGPEFSENVDRKKGYGDFWIKMEGIKKRWDRRTNK